MSREPRWIAALSVVAGAAALIAAAPTAAADPPLPEPGSENAASTISDLQGRGYNVQINYDNGIPDEDLSQCWVNAVNTVEATGSLRTAFVDIECPR
jgi:hypothetical protein